MFVALLNIDTIFSRYSWKMFAQTSYIRNFSTRN